MRTNNTFLISVTIKSNEGATQQTITTDEWHQWFPQKPRVETMESIKESAD